MICPHCTHELEPQKMGSTVYWLCGSCNALWFDNKETDFLSLDEAKSLTELHNPAVLDHENTCVFIVKTSLQRTLFLHCYTCGGITSCELLVAEAGTSRRAFKNARLPLKTRTVVILGVLGIFAVLTAPFSTSFHKTTVTTQARSQGAVQHGKINWRFFSTENSSVLLL